MPAFACPFEEVLELGSRLLQDSPYWFQPGPEVLFRPITLLPQDVETLAELIIYEIKARRIDYLEKVEFELKLDKPSMWILPP